ncbi:MAG TPA: response regulator [Vicinamibacterales bacterium]|jgi:DNA-binding response OmpR family regulator|nr:response regulator [Vicinamibacterales bacterium]
MKLPFRVLVLEDDEHALSGIVELLRDAGHNVTGAATYDAAKRLLAVSPFDLLVSDVRLRSFNGLHLVMQTRTDHPEIGVIIITGYDDPLIDMEAHRYHAQLVRKPIRPAEFLRTVNEALAKVRRQRRWPRKRVVGGFRVTVKGRPAAVVDVSYGGLRLELPEPAPVSESFDVEVAGIGLHLEVQAVWSQASEQSTCTLCGATLAAEHTPSARTWRAIVDRLSA